MLSAIAQILLALLYANASEWGMHKYILHGLGKNPQSFWAYHLYEHHALCVQHGMCDPGYRRLSLRTWNTQSKELVVLAVIILLHLPGVLLCPEFVITLYACMGWYYYKHRKSHLDPLWAKQHLRWHYDHHLAGQGGGNWCVTWPWLDYLLGTRIKNNG